MYPRCGSAIGYGLMIISPKVITQTRVILFFGQSYEQILIRKNGGEEMEKDIKFKLLQLGKKQVDLLRALRDRGQKVSPQELSCFISGVVQTPKSDAVLNIARDILKEWQKEN